MSSIPTTVLGTKVGRNDPCPCGSGTKFKHCCIEASLVEARPATTEEVQASEMRLRELEEQFGVRAYETASRRKVRHRGAADDPDEAKFLNPILVSARYSDEYDYMGLLGIVAQAVQPIVEMPEAQELLAIAGDIMKPDAVGAAVRGRYPHQWLRVDGMNKPVALEFWVGDLAVLLALTTAAKANIREDNGWCQVLPSVLRRLRPEHWYPASVTRVVRSRRHAAPIHQALSDLETTVHPSEFPSGLRLSDEPGRMLWDSFCLAAEVDHRQILTRTLTGSLFRLRNGLWPTSKTNLPLGFGEKRDASGAVIRKGLIGLGPANDVALAKRLIELGAEEDEHGNALYTDDEIAAIVGPAGLTSRQLQRDHPDLCGPDGPVTVDQARHPGRAVNRRWRHLLTYLSGKYRYTVACTLPKLDTFAGLEVRRDGSKTKDPYGYFAFELQFDVPPGAFGDAETIERCIKHRAPKTTRVDCACSDEPEACPCSEYAGGCPTECECDCDCEEVREHGRQASGGNLRSVRKALANLPDWSQVRRIVDSESGDTKDEEWQYHLSSVRTGCYYLYRRPMTAAFHPATRLPLGWSPSDQGTEWFATIDAKVLHQRLATACIDAIEQAIGMTNVAPLIARRPSETSATAHGSNLPDLRRQRTHLEKKLRSADLNAEVAGERGDKEKVRQHQEASSRLTTEIAALDRQIASLEIIPAQAPTPTPVRPRTVADWGDLAFVLAELLTSDSLTPAAVNQTLLRIISTLRLVDPDMTRDSQVGAFEITLDVPTDHGPHRVGPVSVTFSNRRDASSMALAADARGEQLAGIFFGQPDSLPGKTATEHLAALAAIAGRKRRFVRESIIRWLGRPAEGCSEPRVPSPEARAVLVDLCPTEARRAMWATLTGDYSCVADLNPGFVAKIAATYLDTDFEPGTSWWRGTPASVRVAFAALMAADNPPGGLPWPLLAKLAGVTEDTFNLYARAGEDRLFDKTGDWQPRGTRSSSRSERGYAIRECQYCRQRFLTVVAATREVPGRLLCRNCKKAPGQPGVVYPDSYVDTPWEAPPSWQFGHTQVGTWPNISEIDAARLRIEAANLQAILTTPPARLESCGNCGAGPVKAAGRCNTCYGYRQRTGTERPAELWERKIG